MVFSSTEFLFIFLPLVYLLCLIFPWIRVQNWLLIAASLIFYAYGEPVYVLLMLFSVVFNYIAGLLVRKGGEKRKVPLIAAVTVNLGLLCVFKYAGFLVSTFDAVTGLPIPIPQITLPIGISFFTFQALSYVIDVYRGDTPVQKRFSNVLLYISFFPQLIAGPILKYHDVDRQIENRKITVGKSAAGIRRFIFGMSKKLLIANTAAKIADTMFGADPASLGAAAAWLGAIAYCIQIYFDFSGYSDMAIGLGQMFGFDFAENFNYPYISQSVTEFWRRWHISLSTWFKEYLYIPLGGNRKGKVRTGINKLIVFFCTGLWHGANLTFIVWGMFHGLFMMLESYGILPIEKCKLRFVRHLYTLLVVCTAFVMFRADSISQAGRYLWAMFTGFGGGLTLFLSQLTRYNIFIFIVAIILSIPVAKKLEKMKFYGVFSYGFSAVLLLLCILTLSSTTYNPFIYFIF